MLGECVVVIKVDEINVVGNCVWFGNYVDVFLNLKCDGIGVVIGGMLMVEIVNI